MLNRFFESFFGLILPTQAVQPTDNRPWLIYPRFGRHEDDLYTMIRISDELATSGGQFPIEIRHLYFRDDFSLRIPYHTPDKQVIVAPNFGLPKISQNEYSSNGRDPLANETKKNSVKQRGDLHVMLFVSSWTYANYPEFDQCGNDLYTRIFIHESTVAEGAYFRISLDPIGQQIEVRVPRKTSDGQVYTFRGLGLHDPNSELESGTLYVKVTLVPQLLIPRQEILAAPRVDREAGNGPDPVRVSDHVALRDEIQRRFGMPEIASLCFDLDIDNDQLEQSSKLTLVESMLKWCERRDKTEALINRCKELRPTGNW